MPEYMPQYYGEQFRITCHSNKSLFWRTAITHAVFLVTGLMLIILKHRTDACQALVFPSSILFLINNKRLYCYLSVIPMKGLNSILNHEGNVFCKIKNSDAFIVTQCFFLIFQKALLLFADKVK